MPFVAVEPAKLELNMTSMIDVVFQLLIFFLVTLHIPDEEQMIQTDMPKARGPGAATSVAEEQNLEEFEDILLTIAMVNKQPKTYVAGQWMPTDNMLLGRLEMFRNLNEKGRVVISCQPEVPYVRLVRAISVVQQAKLSLAFANLEAQ
jgi:biopolymer transport protein ExbD